MRSFKYVVFARVLQGLGSALIQTGALGIVLDECSRADDATTEDAFASSEPYPWHAADDMVA